MLFNPIPAGGGGQFDAFLESLWHKETDWLSFAKKLAYDPSKEICAFLVILNHTEVIQNFAKFFEYLKCHCN